MKIAHGGNIIGTAKELGCRPAELIDMSSNLTPLGTAPGLLEALSARLAEIGFLPEADNIALARLFAQKYGLKEEQVLVGNGTTEFIYAVPAVCGLKRAVIVYPTYGDYQLACEWAGLTTKTFYLQFKDNFALDLQRLGPALRGGELVFICNPNNPTGVLTSNDELFNFIGRHGDCVFLIDESYLPFTREPSLMQYELPENLFVLTSFSKIYGIPGLRLGFLAGSSKAMAGIRERSKPWGVNRLAQIAGEYLLQFADPYVEEVVGYLEKHRTYFTTALALLPGVQVIPAAANFILCYLTGDIKASQLRERLLAYRIMVRNCENFSGLDDRFFRLSLKDETCNNLCLEALNNILKNPA